MAIDIINSENYKKLDNFRKFLEVNGFNNKENELGFKLYHRFDDFWTSIVLISNRLDNETKEFEYLTKKTFEQIRDNSIDENTGKETINTLFELITDLKSFYFFMRAILDIMTRILKELNKNHAVVLPHSFHSFIDGFEEYSKINPDFFNSIFLDKLRKIVELKDERDGLVHKLHSFFFTTDRYGNLGFDIQKSKNQTTGTDYVISIKDFKDSKISECLEIIDYIIRNHK